MQNSEEIKNQPVSVLVGSSTNDAVDSNDSDSTQDLSKSNTSGKASRFFSRKKEN